MEVLDLEAMDLGALILVQSFRVEKLMLYDEDETWYDYDNLITEGNTIIGGEKSIWSRRQLGIMMIL